MLLSFAQAFVDIRNLSELLNESPDIVDAPDAADLPINSRNGGMSLEFKDVWFWYPSQPRYVYRLDTWGEGEGERE